MIPKRGVVRFGKQGELSLRYIGPFEILERVGTFAYWLVFLQGYQLSKKYSMFPCFGGTPHIRLECWIGASLSLIQKGTFEEGPERA